MLSFIVVKNNEVSNLIIAESKDIAEQISGVECIEYDFKLVNPKIGQSVVDGQVVDLEVYPTEEELEAIRIAAEAELAAEVEAKEEA